MIAVTVGEKELKRISPEDEKTMAEAASDVSRMRSSVSARSPLEVAFKMEAMRRAVCKS